MRFKLQPGFLIVLIGVLCGILVAALAFLRWRATSATADLLARFPPGDAVVLFIDAQGLRRSGVLAALAGSKVNQEPEYQAFVVETGFDYERDLDSVLVAFHEESVYLLLRGRFNWPRLRSFVATQEGTCRNSFCRMSGSAPQRNISFFPLAHNLMAMAVSTDSWAASLLMSRNSGQSRVAPPAAPVWLLVPASFLKDNGKLPAGTRLFAKAMEGAETILLTLGPRDGRFEVVLDVTCRSAQDAELLSLQLQAVTRLLRQLIEREDQKPNPKDLSGVLAAGAFQHSDVRVTGRWPVERVFLESLVGGSL